MRQLKSAKTYAEGRGVSYFLAAFGALFVIVAIVSLLHDGSHGGGFVGHLITLCFGVLLVWGGLSYGAEQGRYGRPTASVSTDAVTPGEAFDFAYRLPVKKDLAVTSIQTFLVLRERVRYTEEDLKNPKTFVGLHGSRQKPSLHIYLKGEKKSTTVYFDRLFQQEAEGGWDYHKNDAIELNRTFCLPEGDPGIRNSLMNLEDAEVHRQWVMKVRIQPQEGHDIWGEFDLEAPFDPHSAYRPKPDSYDVLLLETPLTRLGTIIVAAEDLLPHLRTGQFMNMLGQFPVLFREELPYSEAQAIKMRLVAAGARVELQPSAPDVEGAPTS